MTKGLLPGDNVTDAKPSPLRRTLLQASLGLGVLGLGSARAAAQASTASSAGVALPPAIEAVSAFRVAIVPDAIEDLRRRPKLFYWNKVSKGGHFAAFEQPALFTAELSACFARVRT